MRRLGGAHLAGTLMIVSTLATIALEEVAANVPEASLWYQLYIFKDRGLAKSLLHRARDSGYRAIVLTVDTPLLGRRRRDVENEFVLPPGLEMANLKRSLTARGESGLEKLFKEYDPSLSFDDLAWVKEESQLPLVVKGVHRGDDAKRCVEAGADAVIVSNHGGRQLDTAVATAEVLEEVATSVGDRAPVFIDGGIRRGTDLLKALALGAKGAFIGRPVLWGLSQNGSQGVKQVFDIFRQELTRAMMLCGVSSVREVPRDLVGNS